MFMFNVNRQAVLTVVTLSIVTVLFGMVGMVQAEVVQPYANDSDTALLYHLNETTGSYSSNASDHFIDDSSGSGQHMRTMTGNSTNSPFQGVSGPNGLGAAATISSTKRMFRVDAAAVTVLDTETFTIEAWIRNPGVSFDGVFRADGDEGGSYPLLQFGVKDDDKLMLGVRDSAGNYDALTSTVALSFVTDRWYHVAVTYNGDGTGNDSQVKFYCDPVTDLGASSRAGTQLGSTITSDDLLDFTTTGNIYVGDWNCAHCLDGDIDEVRYSNVVRDTFNLAAVPEPGSLSLLAAGGFAALLMLYRRRRKV